MQQAPIIFREGTRIEPVVPWLVCLVSAAILVVTGYLSVTDVAERTSLLQQWGVVPARLQSVFQQSPANWLTAAVLTPLSALLIHASWLHVLGNLAYLWAFGLTVERFAGHFAFALTFFIAGGISNLMLAFQLPDQITPVIGASGGVSAIIGCYLWLYPRRRLGLYIPLGLYLKFARLPALLVIGSWFALQVIYTVQGPVTGDVAWRVHVVGFGMGILAGMLIQMLRPLSRILGQL